MLARKLTWVHWLLGMLQQRCSLAGRQALQIGLAMHGSHLSPAKVQSNSASDSMKPSQQLLAGLNSVACTLYRLMPCWWKLPMSESFHGFEAVMPCSDTVFISLSIV